MNLLALQIFLTFDSRLFSEDGNFTVDETKALIKKLTTMEKLKAKEFTKNKENIEDIYDDFVADCEGRLETPLQK